MERPQHNHSSEKVKMCIVSLSNPEYDHAEPLGAFSIAAVAEARENVDVEILDLQLFDRNEILERLKASKPEIICMSLLPGSLDNADQILTYIHQQKDYNPLIVLGHIVAHYNAEAFLEKFPTSIIVKGEGEEAMTGILDWYFLQKSDLLEVPNLVYQVGGQVVATQRKPADLAKIPLPDRRHSIPYLGKNIQSISESSRGCKYRCTFCNRGDFFASYTWRGFPLDRVFQDIINLSSVGVKGITFADEEFVEGGFDRVEEFARGLKNLKQEGKINPDFQFTMALRVDELAPKNLGEQEYQKRKSALTLLKESGWVWSFMGVESGSLSQLKRYGKGITPEQSRTAIKLMKELGIGFESGFIMFDPLMSAKEVLENVKFIQESGLLPYIGYPYARFRAHPNCRLTNQIEESGLLVGEMDKDYLKTIYKFKDPQVDLVNGICLNWGDRTVELFDGLKGYYRIVNFTGNANTPESKLLLEFMTRLRTNYINYLEELIYLALDNIDKNDDRWKKALKKTEDDMRNIATDIFTAIENGRITNFNIEIVKKTIKEVTK